MQIGRAMRRQREEFTMLDDVLAGWRCWPQLAPEHFFCFFEGKEYRDINHGLMRTGTQPARTENAKT